MDSRVFENFDAVCEKLTEMLPHGSGINCKWQFEQLKNGKVIAYNSYHCMNDAGYYDGYADFKIVFSVHKALTAFSLHFVGAYAQRKNRQYMLRDYLEDTIYNALPDDKSIFGLGIGV